MLRECYEVLLLGGAQPKKESAMRLAEMRPSNILEASKISGVNPTDIGIVVSLCK